MLNHEALFPYGGYGSQPIGDDAEGPSSFHSTKSERETDHSALWMLML